MGVLTEITNYRIYTPKCRISVNPSFDTVLEIQKLYREDELTDYEKIDQALRMLIRNNWNLKLDQALRMLIRNNWNLKLFSAREKEELLSEISERYISTKKRPPIRKSSVPILDFEEDGDYIYSSFMQDYGIDLIDQQGKLPWKKFLYLFNGLSSDTKIKQVMHIREMEVPVYNGKNMKQIEEIQELKNYYALPVRGGGGQSGLDLLFRTLEGMAKS